MRTAIALSIGMLILASSAWAWPPKFGAEFTFFRKDFVKGDTGGTSNPNTEAARDILGQKLDTLCAQRGDCKMIFTLDKDGSRIYPKDKNGNIVYRIEYNDGYWFQIATDPAVVEVQTAPSSLSDLERVSSRIQHDLFDLAAAEKMVPHVEYGGGHHNLDLEMTFDGDSFLFRQFIVDYVNHVELADEIFDSDFANAPPVAALEKEQQDALRRVVAEFDDAHARGQTLSIQEFAQKIQKEVYTSTPVFRDMPAARYQAVNLNMIANERFVKKGTRRLELRAFRAQNSMEEFVLQCRLLQKRIFFLKTVQHPIPVIEKLVPMKSPMQRLSQFLLYADEAGMERNETIQLLRNRFSPSDIKKAGSKYWSQGLAIGGRANECSSHFISPEP